MVEVQVCVDDDVDAREVEVLLAQWAEAGIEVGHGRVQLRHAGVDQHARIGMVDDVHVDRHPLALGEQVGDEQRRDRGRRCHQSTSSDGTTPAATRSHRFAAIDVEGSRPASSSMRLRTCRGERGTALAEPNASSRLLAASRRG